MHHTDTYSEHSSIIWPVCLNGLVFVYELSGSGFEPSCSHLNFRFCACFDQGVPWHSGNHRVWIHSEMHMWHDKNIQSNAPYRLVLRTQLNYLASLAKWLSVRLWTKWFWIRVQLHSINELRTKLKVEHPNIKISWSTFATLLPLLEVTPSVYILYIKLMLGACKFPTDQHSMTEEIVCSCSNQECHGFTQYLDNKYNFPKSALSLFSIYGKISSSKN